MILFNLFNLRHWVIVAVVDVFGGVGIVVLLQVRVVVLDTVVWWSQIWWGRNNELILINDGEEDRNDGTRDDSDGGGGDVNGDDDFDGGDEGDEYDDDGGDHGNNVDDGSDGDGTKDGDNDPFPSETTLPRRLNVHVCSILQKFLFMSDFAFASIIGWTSHDDYSSSKCMMTFILCLRQDKVDAKVIKQADF